MQFRECNPYPCAQDLEQLSCTAEQDVVMLLDGSGSVQIANSSARPEQNFLYELSLVEGLANHSKLSDLGTRFGAIVYGGASGAQVVSQVTGNHEALLAGLRAATWPGGMTQVAQGLLAAQTIFRVATPSSQFAKHETAVLVTDGRLRHLEAAVDASSRLKDTGARIIVLLVQDTNEMGAESAETMFCQIASSPCADNVLRVDRWEHLQPQLGRFLSAICPTTPYAKVSAS